MTGGGGGQRLLLRPWHRWSCGWRWPLLCTVLVWLLLVPDTTQAAALELAEHLRLAIATMRVRCDPVQLTVTASFGVAQLQPGQSAGGNPPTPWCWPAIALPSLTPRIPA